MIIEKEQTLKQDTQALQDAIYTLVSQFELENPGVFVEEIVNEKASISSCSYPETIRIRVKISVS